MKTVLAALFFLIIAACLAAVTPAETLYLSGLKLQGQRQYQAAIAEYIKSLQAEPRYAYSYKQIGTCKYYLNDQAGALEAYERYYAAVASDTGVKGMIDRIKASGIASQASSAPAPVAAASPATPLSLWHGGFALSLGAGYDTVSFKDWNDQFSTTTSFPGYTQSGGTVGSALEIGLNAGYAIRASMKIGLDLNYLLATSVYKDSYTSSFPGFSYKSETNINLPLLWLGPEFDYVLNDFGPVRLRAQIGLGYITLMGAGTTSKYTPETGTGSSGTQTFSGSGFGFKGGLGLDWGISTAFSIGLDLGYRMASIPAVNYSYTNTSGGITTSGTGTKPLQKYDPKTGLATGNMPFDYSGLMSRLSLNLLF